MQTVLKNIVQYRKIITILYFCFPVLFFCLPGSLSVLSENKLTILIVSNYYFSFFLFVVLVRMLHKEQVRDSVRSPFHFIRQLNFTYAQNPSLRPLVGAEIGVFKGGNAQRILNGYLNIEKLVLVDPWLPFGGGYDVDDKGFDNMYEEVKSLFKTDRRVEIIRDSSVNAATKFDDERFDFVYLDGNHEYEFVIEDLEAWYPKLKKFGVMCGDDFGHPSGHGVIKAVSEFSHKYKLLVFSDGTQFWFVKV